MDDEDEYGYVPTFHGNRPGANPVSEATRLLEALQNTHRKLFPEREDDAFLENFIEPRRKRPYVDTDKFFKLYEQSGALAKDTTGKSLTGIQREVVVRLTIFSNACGNFAKAEHCAQESPSSAWCYLLDGWFWLGLLNGRCSVESALHQALKGAEAKLVIDPKQRDKAVVRECWDEWQKQPSRYKGKAAFARDMREKFPGLESQPVIERWCRLWEKKPITEPVQ